MDPIRNPYVPGAGTPPPELTGRDAILERARITLARTKLGRFSKSFIAVGLRGVGKTVLLSRIKRLAEEAEYRTCAIEAHDQKPLPDLLVPHLRRTLLELDRLGALDEKVKRGLRVLKSFMSALTVKVGDAELRLDIDGETGSADSGDIEADLPDDLDATVQSGAIEGSNVNMTQMLVAMIENQRSYEVEANMMKSAKDMDESGASTMRLPS